MVVKGKLLVGPILTLLGGLIMFLSAFFVFTNIGLLEAELASAELSWEDVGLAPILLYVRLFFTILWGIFGVIGAIIAFGGKRLGSFLAIVGGILGIIGMFVPLVTITLGFPVIISLSASSLFIDAALMLLGGILGLILKE